MSSHDTDIILIVNIEFIESRQNISHSIIVFIICHKREIFSSNNFLDKRRNLLWSQCIEFFCKLFMRYLIVTIKQSKNLISRLLIHTKAFQHRLRQSDMRHLQN